MKEPFVVESIQQTGRDSVEVKYLYRVTKTKRAGIATVSIEYVLGNTLIKSIKANC